MVQYNLGLCGFQAARGHLRQKKRSFSEMIKEEKTMKHSVKHTITLAMLAAAAVFVLVACGEQRGVPSDEGAMRVVLGVGEGDGDSRAYVDTDEPVYTATPTPSPTPTPTIAVSQPTGSVTGTPEPSPEVTQAPDQRGTYTEDDCAVTVNGVTVKPNMDFSGKENEAGKIVEKLEGQSCLESGYDINYYYDGYNIDTLTQNGKQLVYMASFSGGGAKTTRGIGIGSTADDVIAAYGEPTEDTGVSLVYVAGSKQLLFYMEDDVVSEMVIVDTSFQ